MWQYTVVDYPLDGSEGDLETWCGSLAEDGWQLWDAGIGAVIDHEGRAVRRLSLRRPISTIWRRVTSSLCGYLFRFLPHRLGATHPSTA